MVWIALLSGGDYTPEGLYSIGECLEVFRSRCDNMFTDFIQMQDIKYLTALPKSDCLTT